MAKVQIDITAQDKASKVIHGLEGDLKDLRGGVDFASRGMKDMKGTVGEVVQSLTGLSLGSVTAAGTAVKLASEMRKAVVEYSAYVERVDKASMATGVNADQMSRLIQLADDFRVSQEDLTTAMKVAMQNGFQPTVANLAALSDKYLELGAATGGTKLLQEQFGRSWEAMVPLMTRGGDAIRKASTSIADGLIVTNQAIEANRKFQTAVDDLSDSITAWKNESVEEIIPALTSLVTLANEFSNTEAPSWLTQGALVQGTKRLAEIADLLMKIRDLRDDSGVPSWLAGGAWENISLLAGKTDQAFQKLTGTQKKNTDAVYVWTAAEQKAADAQRSHYDAAIKNAGAIEDLDDATVDSTSSVERYKTKIDQANFSLNQAEIAAGEAAKAIQAMGDDLKTVVAGGFGNLDEDFAKTQEDIRAQMRETQDQIEELSAKPYLSQAQKNDLDGLKGNLDELQGKLDETATAHEEAMRRMAFSMLEERAASDGLTENELANLTRLAQGWGLYDQKTADIVNMINGNIGALDTSSPDALFASLQKIMDLPSEKEIEVNTKVSGVEEGGAISDLEAGFADAKESGEKAMTDIQTAKQATDEKLKDTSGVDGLQKSIDAFASTTMPVFEDSFARATVGIVGAQQAFVNFMQRIAEADGMSITINVNTNRDGGGGGGGGGGGWRPGDPPPHLASGGPIYAGVPTLVGERGPELYVPRQSGTIVPADKTAKMLGQTNVTYNIFSKENPGQIGQALSLSRMLGGAA